MGYLNRPEKTKSAIDENGYFHSGDLGKINQNGNLFIIGRMKEIIVTAGGENIAPYPIEDKIMRKLKFFASWAVIIGNDRKFLTLLVVVRNKNDPSM